MHYPDGLDGEGTITKAIDKQSILNSYPQHNIK